MRISDWSSDVCSSDLDTGRPLDRADRVAGLRQRHFVNSNEERREEGAHPRLGDHNANGRDEQIEERSNRNQRAHRFSEAITLLPFRRNASVVSRSEEHTSELQSLMRISYAVFCLKK